VRLLNSVHYNRYRENNNYLITHSPQDHFYWLPTSRYSPISTRSYLPGPTRNREVGAKSQRLSQSVTGHEGCQTHGPLHCDLPLLMHNLCGGWFYIGCEGLFDRPVLQVLKYLLVCPQSNSKPSRQGSS
jgi:hypothetical protein